MNRQGMTEDLLTSNMAWVAGRYEDSEFFKRTAAARQTDYLWLGCADSRLTGQELTGLPPGAIFHHTNPGNLAPPLDVGFLSSLQFSLEVLKVRHVVVCGHYGCGVMAAALSNTPIDLLDRWLGPVRAQASRHAEALETIMDPGARANRLCELNVTAQLVNLAGNPLVQDAWRRGQSLTLHGWIHSAADGLLRDLETTISSLKQAMSFVGGPVPEAPPRRNARRASS